MKMLYSHVATACLRVTRDESGEKLLLLNGADKLKLRDFDGDEAVESEAETPCSVAAPSRGTSSSHAAPLSERTMARLAALCEAALLAAVVAEVDADEDKEELTDANFMRSPGQKGVSRFKIIQGLAQRDNRPLRGRVGEKRRIDRRECIEGLLGETNDVDVLLKA